MVVLSITSAESFENWYIFSGTAAHRLCVMSPDAPGDVNVRTPLLRYGHDVSALQFKLQETKALA